VKATQQQPESNEINKGDKASAPKVYTNKDLPASAAAPVAADTAPLPSASAASTPIATVGDLMGDGSRVVRDEAWWRKRMTTLRDKLAQDESACVPKRELVNRLSGMMNAIPDEAPAIVAGGYIAAAGAIGTDLVKAKAELKECQGHIAVDKRLISDAEEDARVHSVLPGWLRP